MTWTELELDEFEDDEYTHRRQLIDHLDQVLRPPPAWWFIDQIVEAIELAAAGKTDEWIEVDCRRHSVAEVVHLWELEDLVRRATEEGFRPRGGERSWRCEAPKPVTYEADSSA